MTQTPSIAAMPSPLYKVVRDASDRMRTTFTARVAEHGFVRGKNSIWYRCHEHTADVVMLNRSESAEGESDSAKVYTRVDFAIRALDDPSEVLLINGPTSDPEAVSAGGYHLDFSVHFRGQFDRCCDDLLRFVDEQGSPFFAQFRDPSSLLEAGDSPLDPACREWLRKGIAGEVDPGGRVLSRRLLGIKKPR